jgi:UDP-glucose 4-epimerase
MKKILITGGAGFIGTNLIKRLLKEGYIVNSIDNYDSGLRSNHQKGCKYIDSNILDITTLINDYDTIFRLARLSRIQPSFKQPTLTIEVNTIGTERVLAFAKTNNSKVIYAGSSSKWHNPYQSPYATSKHLGEEICKMYKKTYDMEVEICRFYNVYGPHEIVDGDWAAVTGAWRRQIRDKNEITIVGDGEQRRDFTYVDDIVDGLYRVATKDIKHNDAWELGTGNNYSINELAKMFQDRFNCSVKYIPNQKGNYRITKRENDDTKNLLGWKPKDKLKHYVKNLKNLKK